MIDARTIHRKVTRKIYDFSPEQLKNLTSIVWLYRGQHERFLALVADHLSNAIAEAEGSVAPLSSFTKEAAAGLEKISRFFKTTGDERAKAAFAELTVASDLLGSDASKFVTFCKQISERWKKSKRSNDAMKGRPMAAYPVDSGFLYVVS